MECDGLRAEGEFLVLFVFCREQLENRVLETALVSLCSTRENHEGGEYDVMVCGHVCVFLRMMPFYLCGNQSSQSTLSCHGPERRHSRMACTAQLTYICSETCSWRDVEFVYRNAVYQ